MILGVHHVAISTPRPAAPDHGVGKILLLRPMANLEDGTLLAAPNVYLLNQEAASSGVRRAPTPDAPGLAHLCLQSPEAAALWESLGADLAIAWTAPLTGLGGPFRYAYGYGRDGLMWELEETPATPTAGPNVWLAHLAFATQDLKRLAGFYGRLLDRPISEGATLAGSRRADRITGLAGVAMTPAWVNGLNLGLEFWRFDAPTSSPFKPEPDGAGLAALCLQTDDLRVDLAHAVRAGATLEDGAHPWAGGRRARLSDPDGNALHLLQLPDNDPLDVRRLPHAGVLALHARSMEALA
jgi:predicted enzyme related to lactoylglutathione lyase